MNCPHCDHPLAELDGYYAFLKEMDPVQIGTIYRCANMDALCYMTLFHQPVGTEDLIEGLPRE